LVGTNPFLFLFYYLFVIVYLIDCVACQAV
jgi:hypothetical protein